MSVFSFEGRTPRIDKTAYVFENATIIGSVDIGENVWIGPGAVLRGDYGDIRIGGYTAVEDNCVIHARPGEFTEVGEHVTLGHACIVHTGRVSDWATVGMGAVVSDFARVGRWAAVGEGAVVRARFEIPDESIAVGVPAKIIGKITEEYRQVWTKYKENYNSFCRRYRENLDTPKS
ncbi:MAG: gamma carbonic anhydrase family protein [Thermoplasmata archaeon]|uniref:Gamma carbonic anhydrase family protein n=1 Tax=Candidatus Sysuiplasma superficiale TaxID=2823368 RepID=A0A8J7YNJ8_9ARCH|nr:gamma carbonic anhydrase family protein [Candidatus Sysuiplasma superficiale]MBX8644043.1 gamma carbonic anhydrase family protein [Candidatus Sysuiplasma superficiale]